VIVTRLRSLTSKVLRVGELGAALAMDVLTSWLTRAGRTVSTDQRDIIQTALHKYIQRLYQSYT